MKKIIIVFVIFLMAGTYSFAQDWDMPVNPETGLFEYSEVVAVDTSLKKDILYSRAREWVALNTVSDETVLQMDDREAGIIVCKAAFPYERTKYLVNGYIKFTLNIQVKDGRYKYTINNFFQQALNQDGGALEDAKPDCGNFYMMKPGWEDVHNKAATGVTDMAQSLYKAMIKTNDSIQKDEW